MNLLKKLINDRQALSLSTRMATVGIGEDLVRHCFTQSMPSTITPVVAAAKNLTLNELDTLADKLKCILEYFHFMKIRDPDYVMDNSILEKKIQNIQTMALVAK